MAARRLKSDSPAPRRRPLGGNRYFQLILFSTWDHVLGPRIIRLWGESDLKKADTASTLVLEDDLVRAVATYSIDVTGETDGYDSIVEKFFVLHQRSVVVSAFLIHVANPANPKDIKTFSLSFLLPYSELSEWLARRTFMENACRRIISRNLMIGLKEAATKQVMRVYIRVCMYVCMSCTLEWQGMFTACCCWLVVHHLCDSPCVQLCTVVWLCWVRVVCQWWCM